MVFDAEKKKRKQVIRESAQEAGPVSQSPGVGGAVSFARASGSRELHVVVPADLWRRLRSFVAATVRAEDGGFVYPRSEALALAEDIEDDELEHFVDFVVDDAEPEDEGPDEDPGVDEDPGAI